MKYVLTAKAEEPALNITIFRNLAARRELLWPLLLDASKILGMRVVELARPALGYLVVTVPELDESPVAVFCEGFGQKTFVTVAAYLLGNARGQADDIGARIKSALDGLQPGG